VDGRYVFNQVNKPPEESKISTFEVSKKTTEPPEKKPVDRLEERSISTFEVSKKLTEPLEQKPAQKFKVHKLAEQKLAGQRFERKFAIRPSDVGFAYSFLRQIGRADSEYPKDRVFSLYFDTADLDQYERSAAGEYKKNKVRIRWYDSDAAEKGKIPVYLELKSREGFASSKKRRKFTVPKSSLKLPNLLQGILDKSTLIKTLAEFEYFLEKPIKPIILISYQRYRFNEMQTGMRVCLDYDIRASIIAPELGRRHYEIRLEEGVLEVKGPSLELPVTLRYMKQLDVDWSRFSKYGGCLDAHFTRADIQY
jgi:uncharacterized protein YwqG